MLLYHYGSPIGGANTTARPPLNILRRGPITYFSITFDQHKNFYDFFNSDIVKEFLNSVYAAYSLTTKKIRLKDTLKLLTNNVENF